MDEIKLYKKPRLRNPYLIVAWPGMGEPAAVKTPKALLGEANRSTELRELVNETGEAQSLCVQSYFDEKETLLRAKGARPAF